MGAGGRRLQLCILGLFAASGWGIRQCLQGVTINVILLDDEDSPWSLKFVRGQILKAIETDSVINGNGNGTRHIEDELATRFRDGMFRAPE